VILYNTTGIAHLKSCEGNFYKRENNKYEPNGKKIFIKATSKASVYVGK
jgi:hypothetical protein